MSDYGNEMIGGSEGTSALFERRIHGVRCECAEDYVLPDYMGDVKRVLKSSADASPIGKFVNAGEVSYLIEVAFRVMYIDGEDRLSEAVFTSEIEHTEAVEDGYTDSDIRCEIANLAVRLSGPRKICAKAQLVSEILIAEERKVGNSELGSEAEVLECKISVHGAEYKKSTEREYAEELTRIKDATADEIEVISCYATVICESIKVEDGIACVKGNIDARALLRIDDAAAVAQKSIPYEENLQIDHSDADKLGCCASVDIKDCTVSINNITPENDGGDAYFASVVISMTAECRLCTDFNSELKVIEDAFYPGKKNECYYETLKYSELKLTHLYREKLEFVLPRDGMEIRDVLECNVELRDHGCKVSMGESEMFGEMCYNIIAVGDDDIPYSIKGSVPLSKKVMLPTANENDIAKIQSSISDASMTLDTEKLYLTMTLSSYIALMCEKSKRIVSRIDTEQKEPCGARRVTVYYPENGETAWDVAKKYGISLLDVENNNKDHNTLSSGWDESAETGGVIIMN